MIKLEKKSHLIFGALIGFSFIFGRGPLWAYEPFSAVTEPPRIKWEVGVHPGISMGGGDTNNLQEESTHLAVSVARRLGARISLGLEGGHSFGHPIAGNLDQDINGDNIKDNVKAEGNRDVKVTYLAPFIMLGKSNDWGTRGARFVRSYFILGMGWYQIFRPSGAYYVEGRDSGGNLLNRDEVPFDRINDDSFGANIGFGLAAQVFDVYRLGFDLRYHRIFRNPDDDEYWIPTIRIYRYFGAKK